MMIVPGLCVLVPHDGKRESAERLRRWYAEKVKPVAAVWSIEYGRHGTGYHLNVIAEHIEDLAPPGARVLATPIRTTVRATAAYITKREQAPPMEYSPKRNTGYFGQVVDICADHGTSVPLVQAAALQQQLRRTEEPPPKPAESTTAQTAGKDRASTAPPQEPSREQYRRWATVALTQLYKTNERLNRARLRRLKGIINCAEDAQFKQQEPYK